MSRKLKVIGVGSPNGDDALAWYVIDRLSKCFKENTMVEFAKLDRPHLSLVNAIDKEADLILIDAIKNTMYPGKIHRLNLTQLTQNPSFIGSHGFTVVEALQLAESLGELSENCTIYGIEVDEVNFGETLSPIVKPSIDKLVAKLCEEIQVSYVTDTSCRKQE